MTSTSMKKMQGLGLPPLCHEGKDSQTDKLEEVMAQFDCEILELNRGVKQRAFTDSRVGNVNLK